MFLLSEREILDPHTLSPYRPITDMKILASYDDSEEILKLQEPYLRVVGTYKSGPLCSLSGHDQLPVGVILVALLDDVFSLILGIIVHQDELGTNKRSGYLNLRLDYRLQ